MMIFERVQEIPGATRVPTLMIGIIIPQVLAFVFLLSRIISRVFLLRTWAWDDTLIILAWLFTLSIAILFGIATQYGLGHHLSSVPISLLETSFEISYIALMAYQLAVGFTKISILAFCLRIFPGRREKWLVWGTIGFVILVGVPLIIGDILQCNPLTGFSFFNQHIVCAQPAPFLVASAILHTIADAWMMILMVIPTILSLEIPKQQKFALVGVLGVGGLGIVASVVRAESLLNVEGGSDVTWRVVEGDIWTVVECSAGIVCACAPTTRPLLVRLFPKLMGATSADRKREELGSDIELGSGQNLKTIIVADGNGKGKKKCWGKKREEEERVEMGEGIYMSKALVVEGGRMSLKGFGEEVRRSIRLGWREEVKDMPRRTPRELSSLKDPL